jgi:glycosyltransferase involved in cell wall biosynthesis
MIYRRKKIQPEKKSESLDIPKDFNSEAYHFLNPDIAPGGYPGKEGAIQHWILYGKNEGREYKYPHQNRRQQKISVVMASYLGEYSTEFTSSAKDREAKFERAVNSFLIQTNKNSELIVVADGCKRTGEILRQKFSHWIENRIVHIEIEKQPLFSGKVRNSGIRIAKGDLVCYLDTDDMLGAKHLEIITKSFDNNSDWCYFNDYIFDGSSKIIRNSELEYSRIGTSNFVHKRSIHIQWKDGYGHDFETIMSVSGLKHRKIQTPEYYVCHQSSIGLDF